MHDRRDGVEEGERLLAGQRADRLRQGGEVSGPVATITLPQSAGGRPAISPRSISISGWLSQRRSDGG